MQFSESTHTSKQDTRPQIWQTRSTVHQRTWDIGVRYDRASIAIDFRGSYVFLRIRPEKSSDSTFFCVTRMSHQSSQKWSSLVLYEYLVLESGLKKVALYSLKNFDLQIWKSAKMSKIDTLSSTSADQSQWVLTAADQNMSGESRMTLGHW